MASTEQLIKTLAARQKGRTEADIQADVRQLLLDAPFQLESQDVPILEAQVGDLRRIDVEVGSTVIEVKRDLRVGKIRERAVEQLAGYLQARTEQTGDRYVGVLTDGAEWCCYQLSESTGSIVAVSSIDMSRSNSQAEQLVVWLEGVMATDTSLAPSERNVRDRLGAGSSGHAIDRLTLASLYERYKSLPTVKMKRHLWARLLTTALGAQFSDDDELFIEHTLLVNSAEIIAHAAVGLSPAQLSPASLLSGAKFEEAGIYGVVEADFFDWVIEVPEGARFVSGLARRIGRFRWTDVDHDALKVLYESIIGADTRRKLGEYYTPDWLAEAVSAECITDPLRQKVLDPACGSGTFLFHAVRAHLAAAESAGLSRRDALQSATEHVLGMDLHPVAVALARVTYLLAIGRDRLSDPENPRGAIHVPVFLGDSMQWHQRDTDLWSHGHLVIEADDQAEFFASELKFPDSLLDNASVFDELVHEMAERASARVAGAGVPSLAGVLNRLGVPIEAHATIQATFATMCALHDQGRDHIWGYFIRNLARPVWLARPQNRVDVIVGNPPWLPYRSMHRKMQSEFRSMSEKRGLWQGAKVATHQDLSALFAARVSQLYLRPGGVIGLVMPNGVLDRAQFKGFRAGQYKDPSEPVALQFRQGWDLRRLRPHFFPRGACVIFAERTSISSPMVPDVEIWSGRLPREARTWSSVADAITREPGQVAVIDEVVESPYTPRFSQGASLVPRVLMAVEPSATNPLGVAGGRRSVVSRRSATEKKPWKGIPSLEGSVESEFVRTLYLAESIVPYRTISTCLVVIPLEGRQLLDGSSERIQLYPGLYSWWREAERVWKENRSSDRLSLLEQIDFRGKLTGQVPAQPERLVYTKAGMHVAATRVTDPRAIIDHKLYWATMSSPSESYYLSAILNSSVLTRLVRPLMSYGKDERDIDKYVWQLPIPAFDSSLDLHSSLAELGRRAEQEISSLPLDPGGYFVSLRQAVRSYLASSAVGEAIERGVESLLA